MPMEVTCGQCHQPLLVEAAGVVVACPHCGAHLEIPDEEPAAEAAAVPEAPQVGDSGPSSVTDAIAALGQPPAAPPPESGQTALEDPSSHVYDHPSEPWVDADQNGSPAESEHSPMLGDSFPKLPDSAETADQPVAAAEAADVDNPFAFLSSGGSGTPDPARGPFDLGGFEPAPAVAESVFPVVVDAPLPQQDHTAKPAERAAAAPAAILPAVTPGDAVPRKQFLMVASYASAVTLILIYVLFLRPVRTHQLESLPDLKPPVDASGEVGMKVAPPQINVAPGHVLRLGESRRFGNVRVTPLKVTRAQADVSSLRLDPQIEARAVGSRAEAVAQAGKRLQRSDVCSARPAGGLQTRLCGQRSDRQDEHLPRNRGGTSQGSRGASALPVPAA